MERTRLGAAAVWRVCAGMVRGHHRSGGGSPASEGQGGEVKVETQAKEVPALLMARSTGMWSVLHRNGKMGSPIRYLRQVNRIYDEAR